MYFEVFDLKKVSKTKRRAHIRDQFEFLYRMVYKKIENKFHKKPASCAPC
jgi:hypothetical protein